MTGWISADLILGGDRSDPTPDFEKICEPSSRPPHLLSQEQVVPSDGLRRLHFPRVQQDLGLTVDEADFSSAVPGVPLREEFSLMIAEGTTIALAMNTEKAKSEFIIAPVLLELRRRLGGAFALFSGVELNVEPTKGLDGVCDFNISGSPRQTMLTAPLLTVVEAKNDNVWNGFGQCIASMVAAGLFNQRAGNPIDVVHGVVTTGAAWKFLRLQGTNLILDMNEYYVDDPGKILGVLQSLLETTSTGAPKA